MKNKIINGDCLDELKKLKDNSIDTLITDPPYGINFMGKKWDYDVPKIEVWKECLRVLKPGGTALIFAGSRTQHRMACNVEDAGFVLKDTIMWLYGSGFPKATDISKQLDKGHKRKVVGKFDVGYKDKNRSTLQPKDGWNNNSMKGEFDITKATTPEAKLWNGWKSHGLKPAYEPILVAVKPNERTYANNAVKWGVSGLNIDGSRIGNEEIQVNISYKEDKQSDGWGTKKGRFPANIILSEGAGKMLDEQSGESKSGKPKGKGSKSGGIWNKSTGLPAGQEYGDRGGASRFFYCAKASKSERNAGCGGLEEKTDEKRTPTGQGIMHEKGFNKPAKNFHPTVKPLKLMEYLCTITKTPTGGIVLDPFAGSGTTLIAAKRTGRDYIGIELEEEYCKIAEARLKQKSLF